MKKLTVFILIIFLFGSSSCVREYVCQCKIKYTGSVVGLPDSIYYDKVIKNTRSNSQEHCKSASKSVTTDGITMTQTCDLY
jgi:hypothetical protein